MKFTDLRYPLFINVAMAKYDRIRGTGFQSQDGDFFPLSFRNMV